ncbi:uncharacterized protein EDB93DRAFT_1109719 [Suillus bovinus]|uniref:uncharacterized protein n=1 Tax=Suillus bovinus TaxID=48563 RepID=UPI001B86E4AF|nr:uncharacterized protein EDB93DRAFT_1109719 [Suillus bovinus]KAG2126325.1 hypothetical protein EDB93DRAFT_1109719 [Suillus bovinus]
MEKAIWMPEKSARKVHQQRAPPNPLASGLPTKAKQPVWSAITQIDKGLPSKQKRQHTFGSKDNGDDSSGHGSDSEDLRPEKTRDLEDKPNGIDTDADGEESEGKEPEATALMLSDKVPLLVTNNAKPVQSHGNSQSARERKQAKETPMWHDVDNAVSESIASEESTTHHDGDSLEPCDSSDIEVVPEPNVTSATRLAQMTASLVRTEKGNVKLLDQNLETQRVVQNAIIDTKGHIIFVNAYPELIDKNQVSLQSLLMVVKNRSIKAIKKCLQTDAQYATLLGSLVEPWIPLLQRDLKATACANINSYFRLSNNIVKAKKLMEQHAYVYALRFDLKIFATLRSRFFIIFPYLHSFANAQERVLYHISYLRSFANTQEQSNDDALPIGKKPYQGEPLIFLLYNGVFDGAKSIGIRFAARFVEIVRNKCNCPEVPIPLLVLVATAIYAALFWKMLGSPGKFNFSGNQFSETYVFHVKFLEDLKRDAPGKFHCMMADIFEAVQALKQKGNDHLTSEHQNALSLLDLDGMADD